MLEKFNAYFVRAAEDHDTDVKIASLQAYNSKNEVIKQSNKQPGYWYCDNSFGRDENDDERVCGKETDGYQCDACKYATAQSEPDRRDGLSFKEHGLDCAMFSNLMPHLPKDQKEWDELDTLRESENWHDK
eukprot:TRINITY_DN4187_c0_g1_i1.p1 TRINITY_DN4187_c0_g1~~TRINITY_DN4187_c0_g1_i1.p1  ORF type:complete len:131 (-),score=22.16 TRINITY_DN4187_c0_g1_i1:310-702(-)